MMVVFAQTAGLTGVEVGVAGGTAVVGQRVLEAVFGDQAVRRLVALASEDLQRRMEQELWEPECRRFLDILDAHPVVAGAGDELLSLSREVEDVRWPEAQG